MSHISRGRKRCGGDRHGGVGQNMINEIREEEDYYGVDWETIMKMKDYEEASKKKKKESKPSTMIQCLKCKDKIQSKHRHDWVQCSCENIYVDGGTDYLRMGGNGIINGDLLFSEDNGKTWLSSDEWNKKLNEEQAEAEKRRKEWKPPLEETGKLVIHMIRQRIKELEGHLDEIDGLIDQEIESQKELENL